MNISLLLLLFLSDERDKTQNKFPPASSSRRSVRRSFRIEILYSKIIILSSGGFLINRVECMMEKFWCWLVWAVVARLSLLLLLGKGHQARALDVYPQLHCSWCFYNWLPPLLVPISYRTEPSIRPVTCVLFHICCCCSNADALRYLPTFVALVLLAPVIL